MLNKQLNTKKMSDIILDYEDLRKAIKEVLSECLPLSPLKEEPDTLSLKSALEMLKEHGYDVSRAQMYKMTSGKEIPHKIFGNKLVFSRKELLNWASERTKEKETAASLTAGFTFGRNRLKKSN